MSKACEHGSLGCSGIGDKHACDDVHTRMAMDSVKATFIPEEKWLKLREFVKGLADSFEGNPPDAKRIFAYMRRLENE